MLIDIFTPARRRSLLGVALLVIAISRLAAVAPTPWDWDEALFVSAVAEYDVTQHHPHPPGFPAFVAAAKVLSLVFEAFRSYQVLNVLAGVALFPLLIALAVEAGFPLVTAAGGALLFTFLPNVWFYGGTAFSDVSGAALTVAACWLLLRGRRDGRAYVAGAVVLALAVSLRSQAILFGCLPALVATFHQWHSRRARVAAAIGAAAVVLAVSYCGAALASYSVRDYLDTSAAVQEYVRKVDSFLNPARPPLAQLAPRFFLPVPDGRVADAFCAIAILSLLAGVVRRDPGALWFAGIFVPFATFAWLMLDPHSIHRYSVSWVALYAILFVDAPRQLLPARARNVATIGALAFTAVMVLRFATWTMPALESARTESPTSAAMRWIAADHGGRPVFVHGSMIPFADLMLDGTHAVAMNGAMLPPAPPAAAGLAVLEGVSISAHARTFARERDRIWQIARERYFEVSVLPATEMFAFDEGWYDLEGDAKTRFRWMGPRSVTLLPPTGSAARLTMRAEPAGQEPTTITVEVDGHVIDRYACAALCERSWIVPRDGADGARLTISTDRWANPAKLGLSDDRRDLALRVESLGWIVERE